VAEDKDGDGGAAPVRPPKAPNYQLVVDRIVCHKPTWPTAVDDNNTLFWTSVVVGAEGKPSRRTGTIQNNYNYHIEYRNNPQNPERTPSYQYVANAAFSPYTVTALDATQCTFSDFFSSGANAADVIVWLATKLVKGKQEYYCRAVGDVA
jgi:hypothetical protein